MFAFNRLFLSGSLALCLMSVSCASSPPPGAETAVASRTADTPKDGGEEAEDQETSLTSRALQQTQDGLSEAALSPLKDLNLRKDPVPDLLLSIKNPYETPARQSCTDLAEQIEALNALLGRDWDVPPPDKAGLSERAAEGASTVFLETIASQASGLIPYRGVVRSVSGADREVRKKRKAYERGSHRRTFLKGLGKAKGCPYPAAPQALPEPDTPKIEFR